MKKNNLTENVNGVANMEQLLNVENMEQLINENIGIVPKVMMKRFMKLSIEEQVQKIQHYQYVQQLKENNRVVNKVKELFDKRKATVDDAKEVIEFCNEFIGSIKDKEIAAIDEEIAKLMQKKQSINI